VSLTVDGDNVSLDVDNAIGIIAECLEPGDVSGSFDHYRYCAANGREVLLGHHQYPPVNSVSVSKGPHHHRSARTWEQLREYLRDGWVIGTERYPGVNLWFVSSGRNSRREVDRIFVV
jgi:hypothetical protein